jgi:hypothetical protein
MKFTIASAQKTIFNIIVTNMGTHTVAHLLEEIYGSNEILRKYINFETYQESGELLASKEA